MAAAAAAAGCAPTAMSGGNRISPDDEEAERGQGTPDGTVEEGPLPAAQLFIFERQLLDGMSKFGLA